MNQHGSFVGGGAACEVEQECCRLAGIDVLGAMVGDVGYRAAKTQTRRREQKLGGWKNEQPSGFYRAQKYVSLHRGEGLFVAVKIVYEAV